MEIGAHVSSASGLDKTVERACEIGAEAIQLFASAPQSWRPTEHSDEEFVRYRERAAACGIDNAFLHAIYLVNLASESPEQLGRSIGSLKMAMKTASRMGARGVIFHVGSHKGVGFEEVTGQIFQAVSDILAGSPADTWLILENSAGMGGSIGSKFAELGAILRGVSDDRLRVCLDTCHTLAAGYEVRTKAGIDQTMDEFDREIGLDRLVAVHANDSKVDLNGGKDRHENIGQGFIGEEGFLNLFGHAAFVNMPLLLEVPGTDRSGPDRQNVDALRLIRRQLGLPEPERPAVSD
jgi:deoxyribonuclease IV